MKPILPLCLALILGGLATGCSTPRQAISSAQPYGGAQTNFPAAKTVITSLGSGFSITVAADSWRALTNQTRPNFTWNGRDLMWIGTDDHGQPRFVLDEAYLYHPAKQPLHWVLLEEGSHEASNDSNPESPRFFYSNQNFHAVATLHDKLPPAMNDAGEHGDYAIVLNTSQQSGTVYEIGWQSEMGADTAHPGYGRRLYVLHDQNGRWQFLGEGPAEGKQGGGETILDSHVIWSDASSGAAPQIMIQSPDSNTAPEITATNQHLLKPGFPAGSH